MDATPFDTTSARGTGGRLPGSGRAQFGQGSASALSMRWSALHDAAQAVAALADIEPERMTAQVRNFPAVMRDAGGWRREAAEQGIDDISAMLEPGLAALLAVHARGADTGAPAMALWKEFLAARDALIALAPPKGAHGMYRRA
ncbi:hypothetical protein GCM10011371_14550 [Novosphingobium marinum]|uniref:Uncharacterized protein n=1 Tax=Novosphingobium marinum TaxID=1514948 RepID=A0A7Z0BTW4_9SPHN|nr:hypothetical protein [Novosphingobium marinum]NYH95569.1 hypothetical protein [Novosphingobium marinum]GGC28123.1 hypothetical protein GCM10011371_14550 [Novosphingobium marinum]